jgi:hypothetical protein
MNRYVLEGLVCNERITVLSYARHVPEEVRQLAALDGECQQQPATIAAAEGS